MYTIDVDVGGTFTDGFFTDGDGYRVAKVLTTPHDLTECVLKCVSAGAEAFDMQETAFLREATVVRVSTTHGTNLIVQRRGPKLGLVVTKGAEEALYGSTARAIGQFVNKDMVVGLDEQVDRQGRLVAELGQDQTLQAVRELVALGARLIVVSFANAWLNPHNEEKFREYVRERYPAHYLRSVPIQLSTEIVHVADDHARANSALLNGYVHADIANAFYKMEDNLRQNGFRRPMLVVHANGGNARVAKTVALHTLNSGPAVAARGAAEVAGLLGIDKLVTGDMGGTSFDIAVIANRTYSLTSNPSIDGVPIATPMIEVETIGAGGGSIARVSDGKLTVGPESAGAAPGPVCYDRGGVEPTVTDANLLLGYIDPQFFLGGRMKLNVERTARAMERRIAKPLGKTVEEAALAVRDAIGARMAEATRRSLEAGGHRASDFTFLPIGGSGPMHAVDIAERLGIKTLVAFPFGSVFSAFGGSTTNVQHFYSRAIPEAEGSNMSSIATILHDLDTLAMGDMRGEGADLDQVRCESTLELTDGSVIPVTLRDGQVSAAAGASWPPTLPVKSVRMVSNAPTPHYLPAPCALAERSVPAAKSHRQVTWRSGAQSTAIYDREALLPGHYLAGPAVVEGVDSVYPIPAGWTLEVDRFGFFRIGADA